MLKVLALQLGVVVAAAVVASWWGERGAVSVLIGGASYLVPNLLFAMRLKFAAASVPPARQPSLQASFSRLPPRSES